MTRSRAVVSKSVTRDLTVSRRMRWGRTRRGGGDLLAGAVVRLSFAGDADQSEEFAEGEAREAKAHGHARSHENQFAKCGHAQGASQSACPLVAVVFCDFFADGNVYVCRFNPCRYGSCAVARGWRSCSCVCYTEVSSGT